jgi:2-iminobutanoate/2-iminopropanoate deaminase
MRKIIHSDNAPAAIGPYVQANVTGDFLFTSGQIPLNPNTGEIVPGGIEAQAAQSLDNLKAIVGEAGLSMNDVVKTTVFLADIGDFAVVNGIYEQYFKGEHKPSRSAVQVAALPKGALIEIEAIAYFTP